MDVPDDKPEYRISSMKSGLQDVSTLVETTATRDYTYHELTCRKGEDIVLLNGELVCVSKDWCSGIIDGMKLVPDIDDKETCVVFYGDGVTEEQTDELRDRLEEEFPLLDAEFIDGGQKHYRLIIGLC
jgi:dihydroxyacetone kinase-like predicted kinase